MSARYLDLLTTIFLSDTSLFNVHVKKSQLTQDEYNQLLRQACRWSNLEIARILIQQYKADKHYDDDVIFKEAAGNAEVLKFLGAAL